MDGHYAQQFKKGSLEMILLSIINSHATYGYEIITILNKMGGEILGFTREGTVYPILYRMEESEMITCSLEPAAANGRMKKIYSITPKGKKTLEELTDFWNRYVLCVNSFISLESEVR